MDKGTINIFEVKVVRKDIGFKISAADVLNEFLYLGDEKGNIHSYPIRIGESDVISKNDNDNSRPICRNKIDKILCYKEISTILILAGETLYSVDSGFRRAAEPLATKVTHIVSRLLILLSMKHLTKIQEFTAWSQLLKRKKVWFLYMMLLKRSLLMLRTDSLSPKYLIVSAIQGNLSYWQ